MMTRDVMRDPVSICEKLPPALASAPAEQGMSQCKYALLLVILVSVVVEGTRRSSELTAEDGEA